MEPTILLSTHSLLIKLFLGFLLLGIAIPFVLKEKPLAFQKASFIYTMIFQAIVTLIAVLGFIALMTGDMGWRLSSIIMIVIWAIMMGLEIKKHKNIKLGNPEDIHNHNKLKKSFLKVSIIQILIVTLMVIMMIFKVKGAIDI